MRYRSPSGTAAIIADRCASSYGPGSITATFFGPKDGVCAVIGHDEDWGQRSVEWTASPDQMPRAVDSCSFRFSPDIWVCLSVMFSWIKQYMPKRLYWRCADIDFAVLIQLLVSFVFIQRHFEVTEQPTRGLTQGGVLKH